MDRVSGYDLTMPGYFASGTFAELEQALVAAAHWLASRGANVRDGRIGRYVRLMQELVVCEKTKDFSSLSAKAAEIANALYEAHDLISIHRAFSHGPHADLVARRILHTSKGPVSYVDENPASSSNAARNFAFELLVAERLLVGGSQPHFPTYADVGATVAGDEIAIQCKRIWSSNASAIRNNFKAAEKDLKSAKRAGAKGIIAIDITRAVNPAFILPTLHGHDEVRRQMVKLTQDFVDDYASVWNEHKTGTIALLVRVTALIQQADGPMFTHTQQYSLTPLQRISNSETIAAHEFGAILEAAAAADSQRLNVVTNVVKTRVMSTM
jgi:hypothetical protein